MVVCVCAHARVVRETWPCWALCMPSKSPTTEPHPQPKNMSKDLKRILVFHSPKELLTHPSRMSAQLHWANPCIC